MELNRPQLSVSILSLLPLIKPDERVSRIRLSGPLLRIAFGLLSAPLPRRLQRQEPESIPLAQQFVGVVAPHRLASPVFAPQPPPLRTTSWNACSSRSRRVSSL